METEKQDLFKVIPSYKLFSAESIRVGAFVGGPLVAAWLMHENEKKTGRTGKEWFIWLTAIGVMVLAFAVAFILPENMPSFLIALIYSFAASGFANYVQGDILKAHETAGGLFWSRWRAAGIALIGTVIMVGIYFGIFLLLDQYFGVNIPGE